jgi:hypothetical protein
MQDSPRQMLRKVGSSVQLAKNDFVFLSHQGYSFLYFQTGERAEDPPVWHITDSEQEARRVADSFTDWLQLAIKDDIQTLREFGENPLRTFQARIGTHTSRHLHNRMRIQGAYAPRSG